MLKKSLSVIWHTEVAEKSLDAKNFSISVSLITLRDGPAAGRLTNAPIEEREEATRGDHLRRHARDRAHALTAGGALPLGYDGGVKAAAKKRGACPTKRFGNAKY